MTKVEKAFDYHKKGFNCAQSVVLPFCEELGLDPVITSKAMEGFGGGMGGYDLVCGALSGAVFLTGIKNADGDLEAPASKRGTYAVCKDITESFKRECGSHLCPEIKGFRGGAPLKSCNECIACSVRLCEEMLK